MRPAVQLFRQKARPIQPLAVARAFSSAPTMAVTRYVRFHPKSDPSQILLGQPVDDTIDVGQAVREGQDVAVRLFSGSSVLRPGQLTDRHETIGRILSPVTQTEAGTIRCIGLNYKQHAEEVNLALPTEPTLFLKPATALADPWPAPTVIPKFTIPHDSCDYESELAVVLGRDAKDVTESDAHAYILGYTAANDVSSRTSQFSQSQWCFSKSFDGACPLGPVLVAPRDSSAASLFAQQLHIRGLKNGHVVQDCPVSDLVFSVPRLVSFLSQGTTLPAGTVILTGTPAGVGVSRDPKGYLRHGDEFSVQVSPWVGTLTTRFENGV